MRRHVSLHDCSNVQKSRTAEINLLKKSTAQIRTISQTYSLLCWLLVLGKVLKEMAVYFVN